MTVAAAAIAMVRRMPALRKQSTKSTPAAAARPRAATNADLVPEGQRPCPICGAHMQSVRRAAEVIDVCAEHGVWLDRWELERLVGGHGVRARRRSDVAEVKARRELLWWPFGDLLGDLLDDRGDRPRERKRPAKPSR